MHTGSMKTSTQNLRVHRVRRTHAYAKRGRETDSDKLDLGSFEQSSKADDGHTHAIWSQPNSGLQKGSWKEQ